MKRLARHWLKTTSASVLGVDTNVLVRFFVRDDAEQFALAEKLIGQAGREDLFISPIVMVELGWVLRQGYKFSRGEVNAVLEGMAESMQFRLGMRELVVNALALSRRSGAEFSDALIALLDAEAGCAATVTFDIKARRLPQMIAVAEALT